MPETLQETRYSIGTEPAMRTMVRHINENRSGAPDSILIDLETLVRNLGGRAPGASDRPADEKAPVLTVDQAVRKLGEEIQNMTIDLRAAYEHRPAARSAVVLFYWADQIQAIPESHRRKSNSQSRMFVSTVMGELRTAAERQGAGKGLLVNWDKSHRHVAFGKTLLPNNEPSYKALDRGLRDQGLLRQVLLFSKCPLDFHIQENYRSVTILESFTGNLRHGQEWGAKVFKCPELPFTRQLHTLLGDKEYLAPALDLPKRKQLIQWAKDESWLLKSKDFVERSLKNHNCTLPYLI